MPSANITKRVLADTIRSLMADKPLAKISVGEIASACGITRNSFYYHFKDKYDLVNWIFHTEITMALNKNDMTNAGSWELAEVLCALFYEDKVFYKNAFSVAGQNSFAEYFNELIQAWVHMRASDNHADDEDLDFLVSFYSDILVGAISRWLLDGAKIPPGEFIRLIKKAAMNISERNAGPEDF